MPTTPQLYKTPPVNGTKTVTTSSTLVLAGNSARTGVRIVNNDQGNRIWVSEGEAAVVGRGECLFPAGDYKRNGETQVFKGDIYAIAENASCVASFIEEYE